MVIVLKGYLDKLEIKDAVTRIMKAIDILSPGFTVINDISEFSPVGLAVVDEMGKAQAYSMKKGVGKTIRVVGNVLSQHQLNKAQKKAGVGYDVIEVESMEEALKLV